MSTDIFDDFYNLIDTPNWRELMEKLKPVLAGDDLEKIQSAKEIMEYVANNHLEANDDRIRFEYSYYNDNSECHPQVGTLDDRLHQHSNELGALGWEIAGMTELAIPATYDNRKMEGRAVRIMYKRCLRKRWHL
jgi:hypothetical protein